MKTKITYLLLLIGFYASGQTDERCTGAVSAISVNNQYQFVDILTGTVRVRIKPLYLEATQPIIKFSGYSGTGVRVTTFGSDGTLGSLPLDGFNYTSPTGGAVINNSAKTIDLNVSWLDDHFYTQTTSDSRYYPMSSNPNGYLTSFTETDPVWNAQKTNYYTKTQSDGLYQPIGSYLTSESDPVWNAQKSSYLTTSTAASTYQPIGSYLTAEVDPNVPSYAKSLSAFSVIKSSTDPLYKPIGYTPSSGEIDTALGYTPLSTSAANASYYPLSGNPSGFITQSNVYTNGYGVSKSGTEPNVTFSINTTEIMTAQRAADSIAALDTKINGKVPASRTINGKPLSGNITLSTSDISEGSNQYFTNTRARSAITLTTTGTSGAATYNNATGVLNVPNYATSSYTQGTGISIASNVITNTAPNVSNNSVSVVSSGTVYPLSTTSQKIDFGTTDPVLTLPTAGTYLIQSNLTIEYNGLTNVSLNACNFKLRRTNNTAADLSATGTFKVPPVTLLSQTGGDADMNFILYTTATSGDIIEMWGNRSLAISLGSIDCVNAWITAVRLY